MQTIWHDEGGRVKAVYDGDTTSTVWSQKGYSKAASDPREIGRLSPDYVVTVSDGKVTGAVYDPAAPTKDEWARMVAATRYRHEISGARFSHENGTSYGVATDRESQTKAIGACVQAQRAQSSGNSEWSKQWKTAQGFVTLSIEDALNLGDAVDAHVQACFDRESDLLDLVADGSITESDLEMGWPGTG